MKPKTAGSKRYYILSAVLAVSCLALTAYVWRSPWLLFLFLLVNGGVLVVMGKNMRRDIALFVFSALFGAAAESFVIQLGGAWSYPDPQLFGIPIWLPLVWGTAGVFLVRASGFIGERLAV